MRGQELNAEYWVPQKNQHESDISAVSTDKQTELLYVFVFPNDGS